MKPTKLPSGAWRCRVYVGIENGVKKYQSITRSDYYECLEEAVKLSRYHHETARDQSKLTLHDAIDKYLSMKSNVLSPATIRSYRSIQKNHLQPEMDLPLKNITHNVAQAAINRESSESSPKTVQNIFRLLSAVVNQFEGRNLKVQLPQITRKEHANLTEDQIRTLLTALQGDESEVPILLSLFLGLRRSEAMALQHSDYDPKYQTLTISKAKVPNEKGEFVVKTTKNKSSQRKISIPPYLASRLEARIKEGKEFYAVAPERPYKRLQTLCKRFGISRIGIHDLRHQNASIMLKLGVPDKYAMERGGWSTASTMKNIYQHTFSEERSSVEDTVNAYFEGLMS